MTLQHEIDMVRANRYEVNNEELHGSSSVPRAHRHTNDGKSQHQQLLSQQEQFLRSASARLPKKEEDPNRFLDGEKKREESMKRLLEWKQRMLQSPLTRKGPQLTVAPVQLPSKSPLTIQDQSNFYHQESQKNNHALQRSRSDTHAIAGYGNEDSNDEEGK
jgi:hypothetical protein